MGDTEHPTRGAVGDLLPVTPTCRTWCPPARTSRPPSPPPSGPPRPPHPPAAHRGTAGRPEGRNRVRSRGEATRSPRPAASTHLTEAAVPHEGGGAVHLVKFIFVSPRGRCRRVQRPPQHSLPIGAEGRRHIAGNLLPLPTCCTQPANRKPAPPPSPFPEIPPPTESSQPLFAVGRREERAANGKRRPVAVPSGLCSSFEAVRVSSQSARGGITCFPPERCGSVPVCGAGQVTRSVPAGAARFRSAPPPP